MTGEGPDPCAKRQVPQGRSLLLKNPDSREQMGALLSQDRHQGDVQLDWARRALCVCAHTRVCPCVLVCTQGRGSQQQTIRREAKGKKGCHCEGGQLHQGPEKRPGQLKSLLCVQRDERGDGVGCWLRKGHGKPSTHPL